MKLDANRIIGSVIILLGGYLVFTGLNFAQDTSFVLAIVVMLVLNHYLGNKKR